jgi:hypothetical protein
MQPLKETSMHLELTQQQAQELAQALRLHLGALEREISRTENAEYRRSLRATYDLLEQVAGKVRSLEIEPGVYA